jgi:hypothetical protein
MPKLRTLADGSKYVTCDEKITRRLDAITKYDANHVESGCAVIVPAVATLNCVGVEAGVIVMNNQRKTVNAVASLSVGTWTNARFATIYIPSTAAVSINPTSAWVASSSTAWCPDYNMQGTATTSVVAKESILLAHVYRDMASSIVVASHLNNNVKPRLYFDTAAWTKDDNTDTDTTINFLP